MAEKSLITIDQFKPVDLFLGEQYKDAIEFIRKESTIDCPTVKTAKGKALIRSTAAKIASSKTFLEKIGKSLSDKKRAEIEVDLKKILEVRNTLKTELELLRIEVRKPLTEFEEQEKTDQWNEAVRLEIIRLHGEALEENRAIEEKKQFEIEKAKLEAEKIRLAAEEKARNDLQDRENQRLADAKRNERDAQLQKERVEREAAQAKIDYDAAIKKAEQDKIDAAKRADEDKQFAIDQANLNAKREADHKEQFRIEKERLEREADEKRTANIQHRKKINNEVLSDLMAILGDFDNLNDLEGVSKIIIYGVVQGKIRNVKIEY